MGWGDVVAGIGGAAQGADSAMRFYDSQAQKAEAAQLRTMIAILSEEGRMNRAGLASETTRRGQDLTAGQRAEALKQKTDERLLQHQEFTEKLGQEWNIFGGRDATTRRGQDIQSDLGWANNQLGYERDYTAQRGQDIGAATTRRGQDIGATTAAAGQAVTQRGQDIGADVTQRGQDITDERGRAGLQLRSMGNWFQPEGQTAPTVAPRPSSVVVPPRIGPGGGGAPVPVAPSVPPSPAGASSLLGGAQRNQPVTPPTGITAPPTAPTSPAAQSAGKPMQPPPGVAVGKRVKLRDGRIVVVKAINPDGTIKY